MKRTLYVIVAMALLVSCKDKTQEKKFEVNGKLVNAPEKVVYLEEVPMATMQKFRVDSATLDKDGKFVLKGEQKEATAYLIRVGNNDGPPLAALINDASPITVNATYTTGNAYAETYEVKGSAASTDLKEFMIGLNSKLQAIYFNAMKRDSLRNAGAPDSLIASADSDANKAATEGRALFDAAIKKSNNPALSMFILGNYQAMANNPAFNMAPVSNEEVNTILSETAAKFPDHKGIVSLKNYFDTQMGAKEGWVGKEAPDFTLPDPSGKMVSLSSYRGKYVLVDFWASWCRPCRYENPNVVAAYKKFKGEKFDILGVSLDKPDGRQDWLDAIKDDGLTWTQVSDLKDWNSAVVPMYGFGEVGIPYNILVDPQGKVIAERLTGPALESKLAEVLK